MPQPDSRSAAVGSSVAGSRGGRGGGLVAVGSRLVLLESGTMAICSDTVTTHGVAARGAAFFPRAGPPWPGCDTFEALNVDTVFTCGDGSISGMKYGVLRWYYCCFFFARAHLAKELCNNAASSPHKPSKRDRGLRRTGRSVTARGGPKRRRTTPRASRKYHY